MGQLDIGGRYTLQLTLGTTKFLDFTPMTSQHVLVGGKMEKTLTTKENPLSDIITV